MPLKKGGFDQLYNLQAFAARGQVICAIGTHDSTTDTTALHPLLAAAAANLAAAGVAEQIGKATFDAGYASEDNFTAPCDAELYVAITRESVQAGKLAGGATPPSGQPGWQAMAARLDTPREFHPVQRHQPPRPQERPGRVQVRDRPGDLPEHPRHRLRAQPHGGPG